MCIISKMTTHLTMMCCLPHLLAFSSSLLSSALMALFLLASSSPFLSADAEESSLAAARSGEAEQVTALADLTIPLDVRRSRSDAAVQRLPSRGAAAAAPSSSSTAAIAKGERQSYGTRRHLHI